MIEKRSERSPEQFLAELKEEISKYPYESKFVIHDHKASHHHFDLRIKRRGKLVSWALPKANMPRNTGDKVLAVRTPDHPMYWLNFQGEIPEGEYGAGTVEIYDSGACIIYSWLPRLVVEFKGKKTTGFYSIIQMDKDYLLVRMDQEKAKKKYTSEDL